MSRKTGGDKPNWIGKRDAMTDLALTIRTLREGLNLTQTELGRALGVSRAAISAWESGVNAPRGKRLKKLSDALGVTVGQLMGGDTASAKRSSGTVIAVESDGSELPLVTVKSCAPALWAKTRQRVLIIEERSGRRFGILATDETIQDLSNCLSILRELL
jgi:transcriptional regulator with XRE-family HTH domain